MFDNLNAVEESVTEALLDLMIERVMLMSTSIQASSTGAMKASPSTAQAGPS
jgi:hypothetical protein